MATAPMCRIAPPVPAGAPKTPQGFETIPAGADLKQVIRLINQNFRKLAPPPTSLPIPPQTLGHGSNVQGNFTEVRDARVTATVRVFNPDDNSQFVDVEQINGLTFKDSKTGETIVWNR